MPYSIIVWLVNAVDQTQPDEAFLHTSDVNRNESPGAASGINVPPVISRFVYGLFDTWEQAETELLGIATNLQQNAPIQIKLRGNQQFLIPAARVHYVACAEAVRPKDDPEVAGANRM